MGIFNHPGIGASRYNPKTGELEILMESGWTPLAPIQSPSSTYTSTFTSMPPPPRPAPTPPPRSSGVSRTTYRPSLPNAIDTVNAMMPDMSDDQLDDLIDAALEQLRIRGKGKYPPL